MTPSQSKITVDSFPIGNTNTFLGLSNPLLLGHSSHSFSASFGRLGHFLFLLNAWLVIKPPLFDLREKTLFSQLLLKISYGLFNLVVLNNDFHTFCPLPRVIHKKWTRFLLQRTKKASPTIEKCFSMPQENAFKLDYTTWPLYLSEIRSIMKVQQHLWFMEVHPAANKSRGVSLALQRLKAPVMGITSF